MKTLIKRTVALFRRLFEFDLNFVSEVSKHQQNNSLAFLGQTCGKTQLSSDLFQLGNEN